MSLFIYPYKAGSKSVKSLADALNIPRIKRNNSRFQGGKDKTVINWGCTSLPEEVLKCNIINHPDTVVSASNKLKFFQMIDEHNNSTYDSSKYIYRPDWTTSKHTAERWINAGRPVVERHQLSAHSGAGIKIKNKGDVIEDCQLYVMYIKKKSEWRVHVLNGQVVDVQLGS